MSSYIPSKMHYDRDRKTSGISTQTSKHASVSSLFASNSYWGQDDSPREGSSASFPISVLDSLAVGNTTIQNSRPEVLVAQQPASGAGLSILEKHTSRRSILDPSVNDPATLCYPGTRHRAISRILYWINRETPHESVLWLYGSEGVGKSTIMKTIVDIMVRDHRERYAGSFSIATGGYERHENRTLIPTIAYQIANNLPGMREIINAVMRDNPLLPSKSMRVQMNSLIIGPLKMSGIDFSRHTPTVIIDGLDECHDPDTLKQILSIIANSISVSGAPLRFLVASRPEYAIKVAFSRDPLLLATKEIWLNDSDTKLEVNTDAEIEKFYIAGFDKIYADHPRMRTFQVAQPWPSLDAMRHLTFEASGNFLYASTVLNFITQRSLDCVNPNEELKNIINGTLTPGSANAAAATQWSALDRLYTAILSTYPKPNSVKAVLAGILLGFRPVAIEFLMGVEKKEVDATLKFLKPIISVLETECEVDEGDPAALLVPDVHGVYVVAECRCHRSLKEFLLDRGRLGPFFIDLQFWRNIVASSFVETVANAKENGLGVDRLHRGYVFDSAYSLTISRGDSTLPTLLALFSAPPSHLVLYLNHFKIGAQISEAASLFLSLYSIEDYIATKIDTDDRERSSKEILAHIKRDPYPEVVRTMLSSRSVMSAEDTLNGLIDNLSNLIRDHILQLGKRSGIEIPRPQVQLEEHTVHYENVEEFIGNAGRLQAPPLLAQNNRYGNFQNSDDPNRLRPAFATGIGTQARRHASAAQTGHTSGIYSASHSRNMSSGVASSSSGAGARSVYSHASSRTKSTDYGVYYTRMGLSGDSQPYR